LYYLSADGLRRKLFKALEIAACRWAHVVLSQSKEDTDLLKASPWLNSQRVRWLGNGIDLAQFDPDLFPKDTRQQVRQELGLPRDAFVVGIVARPVAEKGLNELFSAMAILRKSVPQAWLLHIGSTYGSRDRGVTLEEAHNAGIAENLVLAGHRDDIARLMTAMDVYTLPSYREGYPRSVMEANAMGLPAVVTDIRGCREAIDDGVNGLLVPARQVEPLAEAMICLAEDDALREKLSQGARRIAAERFDERRVIRKVLDCYRPLLASAAGGMSMT
jgi:glycosyltransferase involved in cell wall biosynthesis